MTAIDIDCIHDRCRYNVNWHCAISYYKGSPIEVPSYCPYMLRTVDDR